MSSYLLKNAIPIIWLSVSLSLFPLFRDQYTDAKWIVFYILFGSTFFIYGLNQRFISCHKDVGKENHLPTIIGIQVPILNPHILYPCIGIFLFYTLSYLVNAPSHSTQIIFQWFILLGAIIYTYLAHIDRPVFSKFFLLIINITIFIIGGISLLQWKGFQPIQSMGLYHLWRNDFPASTFGFQNFTAQCIALSLLVSNCFLIHWSYEKNDHSKSFKLYLTLAISLVGIFCLFLYGSRSSILSFFVASSLLAWMYYKATKKATLQFFVQAIGCIFLVWTGFFSGLSEVRKELPIHSNIQQINKEKSRAKTPKANVVENFGSVKSTNTSIRLIRWKNTLAASLDFPLGMGPGGFSYGYLPYSKIVEPDIEAHEKLVPTNPHNGYLELLIENGWFSLFCFIYLIITLSVFFLRGTFDETKIKLTNGGNIDKGIAIAWITFLSFDALFAFPMEVPIPFLAFGICIGILLKNAKKKVFFLPISFWKFSWIGYGTIILLTAGLIATAKFSEANPASLRQYQGLLCKAIPELWINCIEASKVEQAMGRRGEALDMLEHSLKGQPYLFPVLNAKLNLEAKIHGNDISFPCLTYQKIKKALPGSNPQRLNYWQEICTKK